MNRQLILSVALFASSLFLLSGCSNGASFASNSAKTNTNLGDGSPTDDDANTPPGGTLPPGTIPPSTDPGTRDVAATCAEAAAKGQLMERSEALLFEDPGKTCDFGMNGNLGRRDLWHQARIEQKLSVNLPVGSTLCHVKFDFAKQKFRFDDHFWLNFNDVILASSLDYRDRFGVTNGLSVFDWTKLVGTYWDMSREGTWCMAGASCSWPKTDTEGTIQMNFPTGSMYAVTARDRTRTQHTFSFVTVGDNDSTDCQHRPVNMNVTLQYVR